MTESRIKYITHEFKIPCEVHRANRVMRRDVPQVTVTFQDGSIYDLRWEKLISIIEERAHYYAALDVDGDDPRTVTENYWKAYEQELNVDEEDLYDWIEGNTDYSEIEPHLILRVPAPKHTAKDFSEADISVG